MQNLPLLKVPLNSLQTFQEIALQYEDGYIYQGQGI
jgi:hypothetical protein